MFQIKENVSNEMIIKNSRFICLLYNIDNAGSINLVLAKIRKDNKDATHVCYAYRLENTQKYSDDGEPSGTAGAPIMDVLEKNNITNVLAVVVRYFGGIKLGAGGLIRAYRQSVINCLKLTDLEEIVFYNYYELISRYDDLKLLNTLTKNLTIIKKDFKDKIIYKVQVEKDNDNIENLLKDCKIEIKKIC